MSTFQFAIFLSSIYLVSSGFLYSDPDENLSFQQLVVSRGFKLLSYQVQTVDNYILTLHRVVPKNFTESKTGLKPILLAHGILGSAADFFISSHQLTTPNSTCGDNLGFCLLLTGRYDVWAANFRGNTYSSTSLSFWNPLFWSFSLNQLAEYDLPALIKFIQKQTAQKTIGFIGYDAGASTMLALLSENSHFGPETINPVVALAPICFVGHATSILTYGARLADVFALVPHQFQLAKLLSLAGTTACKAKILDRACLTVINNVHGTTTRLNATHYPVISHFWPSWTSSSVMAHLSQLYLNNQFRKYNYGIFSNPLKYGKSTLPEYQLNKISPKMNIMIMNGITDAIVVPQDVAQLVDKLKPVVKNLKHVQVASDPFNHIDFLFGTGAGKLVYEKIIEYLDQFSHGKPKTTTPVPTTPVPTTPVPTTQAVSTRGTKAETAWYSSFIKKVLDS